MAENLDVATCVEPTTANIITAVETGKFVLKNTDGQYIVFKKTGAETYDPVDVTADTVRGAGEGNLFKVTKDNGIAMAGGGKPRKNRSGKKGRKSSGKKRRTSSAKKGRKSRGSRHAKK